jgi:very-short-patch-repair endonuclease
MKTVKVICEFCKQEVTKPQKEVTRSLKRGRKFFCGLSCAASFTNTARRTKVITKLCPECGMEFSTKDTKKATTYCSVQCSNLNKNNFLTEAGREAQRQVGLANKGNLLTTAETLKIREAKKYAELEKNLYTVKHEFEYALNGFVFDLCIPDTRILIEFDGKYHRRIKQKETDAKKDLVAKACGYKLIRIQTDENPIPFSAITHTLTTMNV